jgi:hypothetical protein
VESRRPSSHPTALTVEGCWPVHAWPADVDGLAHRDFNSANTTRGGARFDWPVIVEDHRATSLYSVDPTDPNHDADIRIGSEAPKQRLPNLLTGMMAVEGREQPLPRIVLGRSSLQAPVPPKVEFSFSYLMLCLVAYGCDFKWKPSGTKPVFT